MSLKKLQIETIIVIPGYIALDCVDIWCQDEARICQQNTTTRLWAETGTRPRAVRQQRFDCIYLSGAVCPATSETETLNAPWVNKKVIGHHLKQISTKTKLGRHTVVIMDGPGWRCSGMAHKRYCTRYR